MGGLHHVPDPADVSGCEWGPKHPRLPMADPLRETETAGMRFGVFSLRKSQDP